MKKFCLASPPTAGLSYLGGLDGAAREGVAHSGRDVAMWFAWGWWYIRSGLQPCPPKKSGICDNRSKISRLNQRDKKAAAGGGIYTAKIVYSFEDAIFHPTPGSGSRGGCKPPLGTCACVCGLWRRCGREITADEYAFL